MTAGPIEPDASTDSHSDAAAAFQQSQFLAVIDCAEAHRRFAAALPPPKHVPELVSLADCLDRVLSVDLKAGIDVPGFDRSNVDGFAVQSADTLGTSEEQPRELRLNPETLTPGDRPQIAVLPGTATPIATGGMLPRGADAVIMIEHTELVSAERQKIRVHRPVSAGEQVSAAGSDMSRGETILRAGQFISSREVAVLAALGQREVTVFRRPRVAILSTGNEIVSPGDPLPPGKVYDSNGAMLAAAVVELGAEPVRLGVVADDEAELSTRVAEAVRTCDLILLSGGTSKGAGDISYRIVSRYRDPGIVAHGVALKPGKPICLAVTQGKPLVVLPGFPTSAMFTFHEFVAPVIRRLAGRSADAATTREAVLPVKVNSEKGRTEYLLVRLFESETEAGVSAFPMGKGSGSVTTFSLADGFITIPPQTELLPAGSRVAVQLLSREESGADLVVIGSHCVGLDLLLSRMQQEGWRTKVLWVGSQAGLAAIQRGQSDIAGVHLYDPASREYNRPYLTPELRLIPGYQRLQGLLFRPGDPRFEGRTLATALQTALTDPDCLMINRNPGSGTRLLLDDLLRQHCEQDPTNTVSTSPSSGAGTDPTERRIQPPGYSVQVKSHTAVAAAIVQGRADWGMAIETVARDYGLGFIPCQPEQYDFVSSESRAARPAVKRFIQLLSDPAIRQQLADLGFVPAAVPEHPASS